MIDTLFEKELEQHISIHDMANRAAEWLNSDEGRASMSKSLSEISEYFREA